MTEVNINMGSRRHHDQDSIVSLFYCFCPDSESDDWHMYGTREDTIFINVEDKLTGMQQ